MKLNIVFLYALLAFALISFDTSALITTTNNASQSSWNEIFSGNQNNTFWLNLSKTKGVVNATLNVSGYEGNYTLYQETKNTGSCSGTWDATYTCANTDDGNWNSWGSGASAYVGTAYAFYNYSKPSDSFSAIFQMHDDGATINASILSSCFSQTVIQLYAGSYWNGGSTYQALWGCFDGSTWQVLRFYSGSRRIYESAIYFKIADNISNPYLNTASSGSPWEWNYTGEFNSSVGSRQANLNATLINNYLSSCTAVNGYCQVPIMAHSDTAGILQVSNINLNDYNYLRAVNSTGGAISTFTANFSNGTYTKIYYTSTGLVTAALEDLPSGATNLTITQTGYRINNTISYTIDKTPTNPTYFNTTAILIDANLFINAFDEKTLSALTFNVTFANSTTTKTWLNQTSFSQKWDNITYGDSTITISSAGYQTRKYYKTITSTMYETLNAYLLSTASGMTVRFHVVSIADQPIQSVVSTAQLSIGGTLSTVEQTKTDSSGTASLFLDPTVTYYISFTHPSYTSNYLSINPTQQDYKITMTGTTNYINNTFQYGDVTVRLTPTGTSLLRHSPGNTTLNYSVSAPSGDLTDWGWFVKWNGTTLYTNAYTSVSGGSDTYFVNTTNLTGLLYVDMFYTKLGTTTWMTNIYTMNNITLGNNTIVDIFSRFGTDNYGFQKTNMLFIGFVAIILMMGYVSLNGGSAGVGVIGWLGLVVLSYAGLIAPSLLVIVGLAVLSIMIIKGVI